MTPLEYYHRQSYKNLIVEDTNQLIALHVLQEVFFNLLTESKSRAKVYAFLRKRIAVKGVYLWGSVGVGKTFLMDCFYHALPCKNKMRIHFHQFMIFVHQELKKYQGQKNPLQWIAKKIAKKALVLCFDELVVTDIADAIILGQLFKALHAEGVCFVATSNVMPDDLYKRGLQRDLFLPAITLIKKTTRVVHLATPVDYRLRHLKEAGIFYVPSDAIAEENMEKSFSLLNDEDVYSKEDILICGRHIKVIRQAKDMVWFEFNNLCQVPRNYHDYLEIAQQYHTVFISHIPRITAAMNNTIALFIRMVDIFYDAKVRLVCSSAVPVERIYEDGNMIFEFSRTRSRLIEMQSENYFTHRSHPHQAD